MKRIKAACLLQTVIFQSKEEHPSEFDKKQVQKEYETYKSHMESRGTKYQILEERVQEDGSIIVKLRKQNNQQAIGDYFD